MGADGHQQFKAQWNRLNPLKSSTAPTRPLATLVSKSLLATLLSKSLLDIDISNDKDSPAHTPTTTKSTPSPSASTSKKPWLKEFTRYLDGEDELDTEQFVVAWWGVHLYRFTSPHILSPY